MGEGLVDTRVVFLSAEGLPVQLNAFRYQFVLASIVQLLIVISGVIVQIIMRGFMALDEGSMQGRDAAEAAQQPPPGHAAAGAARISGKLSDSS